MPEIKGHQDEIVLKRPPNQCWCSWKPYLECPNDWTHVVENKSAPGFMKCCTQHMIGFITSYDADVAIWSKADWEASGHEQELLTLINLRMSP